jgi:L-rhamnose mutarotase
MKRVAFKMKLFRGQEAEYKRRHDAIWPELQQLLKNAGIAEYSIFLDEDTLDLIGVLKIVAIENMDIIAELPIMRKWWDYMKDIMETNPDNSPTSISLKEIFYMP